MKLYHLSQSENTGYDTYSDMVVCAKSCVEARKIHPYWQNTKSDGERKECWNDRWSGWAKSPDKVVVKYLGEAHESIEEGVICSSFHAG